MQEIKRQSEENDKLIFTDEERTKLLVWEAYEGLNENYREYVLRKAMGKKYRIAKYGCISYAEKLVEELSIFIDDFKDSLDEQEYEKFKALSESPPSEAKYAEYDVFFVRHFSNKLMKIMGWKNLIKTNHKRLAAEY